MELNLNSTETCCLDGCAGECLRVGSALFRCHAKTDIPEDIKKAHPTWSHLLCTLPKDHKGPHVACHVYAQHNLKIWTA